MRNKVAFVISKRGEVFFWGSLYSTAEDDAKFYPKSLGFLQQEPRIMMPLKNVQIVSMSCNNSVAIFLSQDGTLYSYGNDLAKRYGILGLGENYHQSTPTPISALLEHRVKQVSVGLTHACALNNTGCLFTWGTGKKGQLGLNAVEKATTPTLVEGGKVFSARQAWCSNSATVVLTGSFT